MNCELKCFIVYSVASYSIWYVQTYMLASAETNSKFTTQIICIEMTEYYSPSKYGTTTYYQRNHR